MSADWYIADQGRTIGPMTKPELMACLSQYQGPQTLIYGPGTGDWVQARHVAGFTGDAAAPPPPVAAARRAVSDEIDYEIFGDDMQFVEVTLDPGETVLAEAGTMMYMTQGIRMDTVFGDPSKSSGSFFEKLMDAGKRAISGESLFLTTFSATGHGRDQVSFAAPYPGKIVPLHIDELGGEIICQKDSFLAAAKGIQVGIAFQKKIAAGLFGGEGFILQRLVGDGIAFVHAGGTVQRRQLGPGETLRLDTGCLVAFQPSVTYDIQLIGGVKNSLFGGEGLFVATLTGPGLVWVQSLPFSRLAGRMLAGYASGKGEGSVLGDLGNLFEAR